MALQSAQLGSLPSLNLGGSRAVNEKEPMWEKVLAAFLTSMAGSAASGLTSNVLSPDMTQQATDMGLAGTQASGQVDPQGFLDKMVHGPRWGKDALAQGVEQQGRTQSNARLEAAEKERLGMMGQQLEETRLSHRAADADRDADRASRESMARDTTAMRKQQGDQIAYDRMNQGQDRREAMMEKMQQYTGEAPQRTAQLAKTMSETQDLQRRQDPSWEAQVQIERMKALMGPDAFNVLMQTMRENALNQAGKTQSNTPRSAPAAGPSVQPSGPKSASDRVREVERNNTAPTASQPGQSGASQAPVTPVDIIPPQASTNPQPLEQHVGEAYGPSDMLGLVSPPTNAHSGVEPGQPSMGAYAPPVQFDEETLRRAALLAKLLGQPQGNGGAPVAAGSGGIPMGYG